MLDEDRKSRIVISYARADGKAIAERLRLALQELDLAVWQDLTGMEGGKIWWEQIKTKIKHAEYLVLILTDAALHSEYCRKEWRYARNVATYVIPVADQIPDESGLKRLPLWMRRVDIIPLNVPERVKWLMKQLTNPAPEQLRVPLMAADPPADFVERPTEFYLLKSALLDTTGDPVAITTALRGNGGFGKTTLAQALCADPAIRESYYHGILWVTIGEHPGSLVGKVLDLIEHLDADSRRPAYSDVAVAGERLAELLGERYILLVIDDLWHKKHAKWFLAGGPNVSRLITTRSSDTLPKGTHEIQVGEMTPAEAGVLLSSDLPNGETRRLVLLAERVFNWPLLISLINRALYDYIREARTTLDSALTWAESTYDAEGLTGFDVRDTTERSEAVAVTLQLSLDRLDKNERLRLSELAVFPEDEDIPIATVNILWRHTADLSDLGSISTLLRFAKLSLLTELDNERGYLRLQDVIRGYLRSQYGQDGITALNHTLVEAYSNSCHTGWSTGPAADDDGYFWRFFPTHLKVASPRAWDVLLTDFAWIEAKLQHTDISRVIADYQGADSLHLQLIRDALYLASHTLAKDKSALRNQLAGRLRLHKLEPVKRLVAQIDTDRKIPWLRPLCTSLTPAGGALRRTLVCNWSINSAAIDKNGKWMLTASGCTLTVWNLLIGTKRFQFVQPDVVWSVAITPDGRFGISGSSGIVKIWDLENGLELHCFVERTGSLPWIKHVSLTSDGRFAICAGRGDGLTIRDLETERASLALEDCVGGINSLSTSTDSRYVVAALRGRAVVWSLQTGRKINSFDGNRGAVNSVAVANDSRRLICGDTSGSLRVFDLISGEQERVWVGHEAPIVAVAWGADLQCLISISEDQTLRVWDATTGAELSRRMIGRSKVLVVPANGAFAVTESFNVLRQWDLNPTRKQYATMGHSSPISAVVITPDNKHAVSAASDNTVRVWRLVDGSELRKFSPGKSQAVSLAMSPDDQHILLGCDDGVLLVLDFETGEEYRSIDITRGLLSVAWSPDGRYIVSSSSDVSVWEFDSGKEVAVLDTGWGRVSSVDVTPDGKYVLSAGQNSIVNVWELAEFRKYRELNGHDGIVESVVAMPDGEHCVSGGDDGTLRIWNLINGEEERTLIGHTDFVRTVAFAQNGKYIVSGAYDMSVKVWDYQLGEEIATFYADSIITSVAATSDGRTIVAGENNGHLHFFELNRHG